MSNNFEQTVKQILIIEQEIEACKKQQGRLRKRLRELKEDLKKHFFSYNN